MRNEQNVAAIVVTYNRSVLLMRCLKSIVDQTRLPEAIYIIDNRSNDNTQESLQQAGFLRKGDSESSDIGEIYGTAYPVQGGTIQVKYVYKRENDGGAGGFYAGMHLAYEAGFDRLWMMDDDGYSDKNELAELIDKSWKFGLDYANALVVWDEHPELLAFESGGSHLAADYKDKEIVENKVHPFNGTFIHRSVIRKIGKVKKEMFIWGDEVEYTARVAVNGFKMATVCTAIHYHPRGKSPTLNAIPGIRRYQIADIPASRRKIVYRNLGYICKTYPDLAQWKELLKYVVAYGLRFRFRLLHEFVKWSRRGARNDFSDSGMGKECL